MESSSHEHLNDVVENQNSEVDAAEEVEQSLEQASGSIFLGMRGMPHQMSLISLNVPR